MIEFKRKKREREKVNARHGEFVVLKNLYWMNDKHIKFEFKIQLSYIYYLFDGDSTYTVNVYKIYFYSNGDVRIFLRRLGLSSVLAMSLL